MCKQRIGDNEKCGQIAGDFDCHADVAVRCGARRPMEHILGFTQSHWMPPLALGECLHHIAAAAAIVDDLCRKHKTLTKNYIKLSNLW